MTTVQGKQIETKGFNGRLAFGKVAGTVNSWVVYNRDTKTIIGTAQNFSDASNLTNRIKAGA